MNKTPVSILQEMMVKKLIVPNYELTHNGGGTHVNTFTYQVSCDGFTAMGTGRSKKDAKHEAAKAMLETIAAYRGYPQLPASPAQSPIRTPLPPTVPEVRRIPPNVPFVNAIGALQDLCAENNLKEPMYEQISDIGPPHAKIFTIECKVATFVQTGIARTKKHAKQEAAKKMLDKISDLVPHLSSIDLNEKKSDEAKLNIYSQFAKSHYPALSRLISHKKVNLGVKVGEYHVALKNSFNSEIHKDLIEKLDSLLPQDNLEESEEDLFTKFKEFLETINLNAYVFELQSKTSKVAVVVSINTCPPIGQFSIKDTKPKAVYAATVNSIMTLKFFLE